MNVRVDPQAIVSDFWIVPGRVEELRRLAEAGYSSGAIAKELATTKNTVIGKANRLGIKLQGQNTPLFNWTADLDAKLRELFDAGATDEAIAAAVKCPSVNIVRGRRWALRMKKVRVAAVVATTKRPDGRKTNGGGSHMIAARVDARAELDDDDDEQEGVNPNTKAGIAALARMEAADAARVPVKIWELAPNGCMWPLGDPKSPDFGYCGCPKFPGLSYCKADAERSFSNFADFERQIAKAAGATA